MPEEYALGNKEIYIQSIKTNLPAYSPDGRFTREAAETAYKVLKAFDPNVQNATIDLSKTYTDTFVDQGEFGELKATVAIRGPATAERDAEMHRDDARARLPPSLETLGSRVCAHSAQVRRVA